MLDFARLFEFNRDVGFIVDPAGVVLAATRGAEQALGRPAAELAGLSLPSLDESGEIRRVLDSGPGAPLRVHVVFHLRPEPGRLMTVDAIASTLWGPDERLIGWFIAGQDLPGAVSEARGLQPVLSTLIDSLGAAVWSFDRNGTVLTWSRAAEAQFGWTREEAEGKLRAEALFGGPESLAELLRELEARDRVAGDRVLTLKGGARRAYEVSLTPLRIGSILAGYTCASVDVTERRQTEELLRVLFQKGRDAVYLVEEAGLRVVEVNEAACRLLGYTREEFLRLTVTDLVPPGMRDRIPAVLAFLREGAGHLRDRRMQLHKDGRPIPTDLSITRVQVGGRTCYLATARDLTEEERSSRALGEAKDFLETIQENAGDGFVLVDDRGVIVYANRRMLEMQGLPRERYVGRLFTDFATKPEEAALWMDANRAIMAGASHRVRTEATMATGARLILDIGMVRIEREGRPYVFSVVRDVTEEARLQAELERHVAEQKFLLGSTRDLVYRHDTQGIFTYISPSVEALTGYPPEEWRVHYAKYMTDHPVNEKVAGYTEETLRTGRSRSPYLVEFYHKSGRRLMMEVAEQAFHEDGRIAGIVGVARDVTERYRADERQAVQQAVTQILGSAVSVEEALPQVLKAAVGGLHWSLGMIWKVDLSGDSPVLRCVEACPGAGGPHEAFIEASRRQQFLPGLGLPGGVWSSRVPLWVKDGGRDPSSPRPGAAEKPGLRAAFAFPVETAGGLFAVVELFHREPRDLDPDLLALGGTLGRQLGQFIDRLRAEQDLRFQKTLLESQSEAAIDGILVVSEDGVMISFNRRFMEMWDISPEVMRSRTDEVALQSVIDKLVEPREFLDRVKHLYEHPEEESRDEIHLKDGRTFDRFSAPVRGADRVIYGRVWYFRDVTGRRRTEENLRRAAEETRRAYEDLKQAQEQLIRSEKLASVGMLISGVAHEINNPLNVMYGNLQLMAELEKTLLPKARKGSKAKAGRASQLRKFRRMIRDALRAAGHARGVVQDFRNFARDVRKAEPVDLNACLIEVLALVQRELRPGIRIIRKLGKLPLVPCLRGQMSQVFLNLVKNAVEAIDKRGRITLRTLKKGGKAIVEVSDTGRGMSEDVLRKLFEPFFTTKPVGKGLGLGLSISAMILHNHGGKISGSSRPGKGSLFRVELPLSV